MRYVKKPMSFKQAVDIIQGERQYQDMRWATDGDPSNPHQHSPEEWIMYMEDYLAEAKHILSRNDESVAYPQAMEIIRKVAAMGVAAIEQNGCDPRAVPLKKQTVPNDPSEWASIDVAEIFIKNALCTDGGEARRIAMDVWPIYEHMRNGTTMSTVTLTLKYTNLKTCAIILVLAAFGLRLNCLFLSTTERRKNRVLDHIKHMRRSDDPPTVLSAHGQYLSYQFPNLNDTNADTVRMDFDVFNPAKSYTRYNIVIVDGVRSIHKEWMQDLPSILDNGMSLLIQIS